LRRHHRRLTAPASDTVTTLFFTSLQVVRSKRATAVSVAEEGPCTAPVLDEKTTKASAAVPTTSEPAVISFISNCTSAEWSGKQLAELV
jgi:hypothetical protein